MKPRCCERVFPPGSMRSRQCARNATVIRDCRHYCSQHDPVAAKERKEIAATKADAAWEERLRRRRLEVAAPALLQAVKDLLELRGCSLLGEPHPKGELNIVHQARIAIADAEGR